MSIQAGPNVFVSRNIDLPEGASISDLDRYTCNIGVHPVKYNRTAFLAWPFFLRSDSDDKDDPHKALGNIVLDDFLDPLPVKVFRF